MNFKFIQYRSEIRTWTSSFIQHWSEIRKWTSRLVYSISIRNPNLNFIFYSALIQNPNFKFIQYRSEIRTWTSSFIQHWSEIRTWTSSLFNFDPRSELEPHVLFSIDPKSEHELQLYSASIRDPNLSLSFELKQIAPREKKMASLLYPSNNEILTRYFQLVRTKKEMNWYQAYHYLPHSLVAFKSLMRGMPCANA